MLVSFHVMWNDVICLEFFGSCLNRFQGDMKLGFQDYSCNALFSRYQLIVAGGNDPFMSPLPTKLLMN